MNKLNDTKPSTHEILAIIDEWNKKYHSDKGTIIFQNKENFSNVRFDNNSLHAIMKNSRGMENLPETIEHPTEIWARWAGKKQLDVLRNYILIGENGNYVVQTDKGIVVNAFFVVNSLLNRYRKGLLMIR